MAVLFVEMFSHDSGEIDFPLQLATLSIVCFKVSHVDFPNEFVLQALNIAFIIVYSATLIKNAENYQTTLSGVSSIPRFIGDYQTSSIELCPWV